MTRNNDITSQAIPTHTSISPRFDELAVLLPQYIDHSLLKSVVENLQNFMFEALELGDCDKSSNENSFELEPSCQQGEIAKSQVILDMLLNTPIADASVLVVITNERQPKLLLTRRAAHLKSHAGEVSFVGGKHDAGDGNNVVTALREACEESALPPSKVKIIGQLPVQTSKSGMSVRPIVALVDPGIIYVPELGEIERIFWGDFKTIIKEPTADYILSYPIADEIVKIKTPCWNVDGEVVWGLTGRIIASLLEICFERKLEWYYLPVN